MSGGKLEPPTAVLGRVLPRARAVSISAGARRGTGAAGTHDPGAERLPGGQAARLALKSGRRLSARRCEGSGVDRAAGQDDEGNQGTVPPRGSRQANLAWLSLAHRTRPDQTLCSRRQRRPRLQQTKAASGGQVRAERRSHASDLRARARLWPGAWCVAAFLFEKFHPVSHSVSQSVSPERWRHD